MHKGFLRTAAIMGLLAVALGAFGAHGLKQVVPPDALSTFETGVRYQFYHALALLAVAIIFEKFPVGLIRYAGICFIAGVILFSGSLYALTAVLATDAVGLQKLGIITPFGGLFFIAGWICLFLGIGKRVPRP
jgi:uncharacterized membrane protein YgdD (TMEM256/DUF423 family)